MIQSRDLEQLPVTLVAALLAVNYSLVNSALHGFISQCLSCPLYPPSSPFHLSPISVPRLFTAFRPVWALEVSHAALLRGPGVTNGVKKKKKRHCQAVGTASE